MGQEVKIPLRAQSKYGLMGSSAKTGKIFFEGHWSTLWIKMPFGIGHPPPTHQLQSTCVEEGSRVPNLQTEFNYLDSFKSYGIFSDFVVPMWLPSSSHHPCRPHIIPVSSPSSPHHPRCPHVVPIAPRRSPCGLHGLWSPHVVPIVPIVPTSSPSSPHRPRHPHIIPTSSLSSPSSSCCSHSPQKVPMWSPRSVVSTCCPHLPLHPQVVPVIPTLSRRAPHHPQSPRYPLHPPTTALGGEGPESVKNAIRFELIKIF